MSPHHHSLPDWANRAKAERAVDESRSRHKRVEKQGREVAKVTDRLWVLGQRNHFQETIATIFGAQR